MKKSIDVKRQTRTSCGRKRENVSKSEKGNELTCIHKYFRQTDIQTVVQTVKHTVRLTYVTYLSQKCVDVY